MKVRDFCSRVIVVAERSTDVREAARLMRESHVGALVVVERRGGATRPLGIVTDRDIVLGVVAAGVAPESISVGELMSAELAVVSEDDGLYELVDRMADQGVRRLPVVTADGRLAGIVTADDVVRVLAMTFGSLAAALEHGGRREIAARAAAL